MTASIILSILTALLPGDGSQVFWSVDCSDSHSSETSEYVFGAQDGVYSESAALQRGVLANRAEFGDWHTGCAVTEAQILIRSASGWSTFGGAL